LQTLRDIYLLSAFKNVHAFRKSELSQIVGNSGAMAGWQAEGQLPPLNF